MHVHDLDNAILQGRPHFPHDMVEVSGVIKQHHVPSVYLDPWVRWASGGLGLQNTQDARHAIDPLLSMARASHCAWCPKSHIRTEVKVIYAPGLDCPRC
jgi:hypothetical protein